MLSNSHFPNYFPRVINFQDPVTLRLLSEYEILVCGEVHGVRENADIAYSLATQINPNVVALESSDYDYTPFMNSYAENHLLTVGQFSDRFASGVMSFEMLTAISVIHKNATAAISFVDSPESDPEVWESDMAVRLEKLASYTDTILCIMGNWHTSPKQSGGEFKDHVSALSHLREHKRAAYIEYKYEGGAGFNVGLGLFDFDDNQNHVDITIDHVGGDDFVIYIPYAHPIWAPDRLNIGSSPRLAA